MMPVVAVLEDDAYVIVWQDDKKDDDDSWGIFGQRFSASGQSEGSEFRLNSYSEEDEYDPDVAALSNGGFVAVWYASEFDDNDKVIVGQRFNAAGKQVGKDTMLNQYITGTQENPAVAGLQNGGFVAVWNGAGQSDSQGAYMRLFSASGNALGDDIRVNAVIDGQQDNADVVQLAGGDIIVTWASKDQDGSGYGIYARLFSDDGTPQDSEFQVNTYWHSNQLGPRVAALTAGGFVVSWYGEDSNDSDGVFARRYDVIGTPDGDQFVVNSTLPQKQHFPCLGTLPDDAFLAAWQSDQQDGDSWGIYHRRFDTADNPFAGDAKANFQGSKKQEFPDCAGFSDGTFVIVWQSENQDGDGRGIFHQRFAAEGYRLYP